MASEARIAALAGLAALLAAVAAPACKALDENDILGALAAAPPEQDDGPATGSVCASACPEDEECVRGACVGVGDPGECQPACDEEACELCDLTTFEQPACVPLCDPSICESCDGGGECRSTCSGDETCSAGSCVKAAEGACANASDLAFFTNHPTYNATLHAFQCGANECGDNRSCIADCMTAGRFDGSGGGPSRDCSRCYAEGAVCMANFCGSACEIDLNDPGCVFCVESSCLDAFCSCAGMMMDTRCGSTGTL